MATESHSYHLPRWLQIAVVGRRPKFTLVRIAILIALVFLMRAYVLLPIKIHGPSMLPTYQENGINFVNRLAYLHSDPQRGDVVAIRYSGEHIMLMKRIVGLPGETIAFHKGRIFINGNELPEPYLKFPCDWEIPPRTLDADHYYVVGDNRSMPEKLHMKGETSRERIVGKILLCKNLFASSSSSSR